MIRLEEPLFASFRASRMRSDVKIGFSPLPHPQERATRLDRKTSSISFRTENLFS